MDNNDSNLKPSSTGGLKLMTVFIAVLALHVVVIGGFTVYHLMSGGTPDADLALDKNHKGFKIGADGSVITDAPLPDASATDKSASAPITSTEVSSPPAAAATPTPEQNASPETSASASSSVASTSGSGTPATGATPTATSGNEPVLTAVTPMTGPLNPGTPTSATSGPSPTPAPIAPQSSPAAPIVSAVPGKTELATSSPSLAPPPEPNAAPEPASSPAAASFAGPVKMPAEQPEVAHTEKPHLIYTVKITDSYKKIAHVHHVTIAQLKDANGIKNNVLHTGQKLVIPTKETETVATDASASYDSAPSGPILANSTTTSTSVLSSEPTTATEPVSAHHHRHLYTIVKGDTLTRIAHKFKTTPAALMEANDISNPAKLTIGKKLKIPSRETRSAKNSEPASDRPAQAEAKTSTTAQLANYVH